jgi:hypothetical protein
MTLSAIECLPVELLQPIFFLSDCNIALIQASNHLGARLSHDYVYNETCSRYLAGPMDGHRIAQTAVQTYIFATKWMTWTFFKSWILRHYAPIGCLCGAAEKEKCFDSQWPPDFENATNMVFSRSHLPHLAFFKARLPKKLLRGPWTTDKVQFLQFLLWTTSMTVDWDDAETRETAIKGRLQAMRERNLDAVVLFNHNRRLGKGADLSILRFAVIHCDCDRSIVYDTLVTGKLWNRITFEDNFAELGEWCQQRILVGDPKGQWLKTKLMEATLPNRPGQGPDGSRDRRGSAALRLNREAGDYDGGPQDQLVVKHHKWYQVSGFPLPFASASAHAAKLATKHSMLSTAQA